ncbi:MAG: hypothetical protein HF978_03785 [Desulfobacteraceae bacterium]|nr:hypothetical protein [Desulfobacteraceae bacterium]MBC2754648.1 hypothetical protein [Desulfobacteraceae bacterium]
MSVKIARIFFIVLLAVSISGCSSILTRMGPLESKLENGEVSVGEFSKYKFSGGIVNNKIHLEKTPQCSEIIEKVHVMQKYPRGRVFVWAEMLLFGLGILDAANVQAICINSKIELPLAKYETANFLVCGEKEPAANEMLVIADKQRTFHKQAQTDANGNLDLAKILYDENRVLNLSIRLASDQTEAVSFIYRPGR